MIRIKKNQKTFPDNTVLEVAEPGTIIQVTEKSRNNSGEILIVTNNKTFPFVNMSNGTLWESHLTGYDFKIISSSTEVIIE